MRFLDLDLDFFLNNNTYAAGHHRGRLGPGYKPWSSYRVRRFLETRCGLSAGVSIPGRTVKNHDEVLGFWRQLIKSGSLKVPFEVIHIDAHPDFWVGRGINLGPGYLRLQPEQELAVFKLKPVHEGNFLTFAIARGWVSSLTWVPLLKHGDTLPAWDADARTLKKWLEGDTGLSAAVNGMPAGKKEVDIPYRIVPWNRFRSPRAYDFMALSRSPYFTPPESDRLIPVIESCMKQI